MGWKRIGNHSYYYRSRRVEGRVTSEYFGRGEAGGLMADMVAAERAEREQTRATERAEREAFRRQDRGLSDWFRAVELLADGAMLAAGYHKHHGQWRRRRMAEDLVAAEANLPAKLLSADDFNGLVKKAKSGDRKALTALRKALESGDYPDWSRWFVDTYGNPAEWVKLSLCLLAGGDDNPAVKEASERKLGQLQRELEGPTPTPIERLLAERAAYCWFTLGVYETLYLQTKGLSFRQAEHQLRKIESAQKRFLAAVGTLARVRKLALPTLQVNIGTNQVNVAQSGSEA